MTTTTIITMESIVMMLESHYSFMVITFNRDAASTVTI